MTERLVEIPVEREIRAAIKEVKGTMTYSQFLTKLLHRRSYGQSHLRTKNVQK